MGKCTCAVDDVLPPMVVVLVHLSSDNVLSELTVRPQRRAVHLLKKQEIHRLPCFPPTGFVTGFERVPVLGMEKIKMTVRVKQVQDRTYDQYYPESHTCFSALDLPLYSTKEIMQTKLTEALSNDRRIYR